MRAAGAGEHLPEVTRTAPDAVALDQPHAALTSDQERALLRFIGRRAPTEFVVAAPGSHWVRVSGQPAMKLGESHTLPGGRTVRYGMEGERIFVSDVRGH